MSLSFADRWFPNLDPGKWAEIGNATVDTLLMLGGSLPIIRRERLASVSSRGSQTPVTRPARITVQRWQS